MMLNSSVDFGRISALIVDGNIHMRGLVKAILHGLGVKTTREVTDGQKAIEELHHFKANMLITALNMEHLDGLQMTKEIRTSEVSPCPYIPIIMVSGDSTLENIVSARDTGIDEFVAKPISAKSLLDRMLAIINNPRLFVNTDDYFGPDRRRRVQVVEQDVRLTEQDLLDRPNQFQ